MQVNFEASQLLLLNSILALMIFGVSLTLKPSDFSQILKAPRAPLAGLLAQFLLLPALTCAASWALNMRADIALGMMLVAACPGGSFSNIMTFIARGEVAVSVSMTAISSLAAVFMTPFNFAFYASLNPITRPLAQSIAIDPVQMVSLFLLVLVLPLLAGMAVGHRWPALVKKTEQPFRLFSMLALLGFVAVALGRNIGMLMSSLGLMALWVVAHNAFALSIGYLTARGLQLTPAATRAVTLEVGIQNSALGLAILFTFFPDQSGMLVVAGFWGIWHLVSGGALAFYWSRRQPDSYVHEAEVHA